ncbi:MAG TPA: sigma-70 family RNA polymerase sigma factor [Anaerolineales bacterium]|nr:sigma-70 family RNA polymerase sigma factor [Anaerolineales bacterium]
MESDQLLLEAAKQMNEDALVRIFDLYATPLYTYALRLVGDPLLADHIVGDVFARLLEQLAAGHGPTSNLRSYLYETAYHLIVDEARASHRRAPLDALASLRPDVHSAWLSVEDQIIFDGILESIQHDLTDDQRHVILLRFLEEFSLRETSAILGKEISHIKVIQNRALAKLRNVFKRKELRAAMSLPREKMSNMLST